MVKKLITKYKRIKRRFLKYHNCSHELNKIIVIVNIWKGFQENEKKILLKELKITNSVFNTTKSGYLPLLIRVLNRLQYDL